MRHSTKNKRFELAMLALLLLFTCGASLAQDSTVYRAVFDSTWSVKLVGKANSKTEGETCRGYWKTTLQLFEFGVKKTGRYDLYVDLTGGTTYIKWSAWGKADGKMILGPIPKLLEYTNDDDQLMAAGIAPGSIDSTKLAEGAVTSARIKDSTIALVDLSESLRAYIGSGGSVTNMPDEQTITTHGGLLVVKDFGLPLSKLREDEGANNVVKSDALGSVDWGKIEHSNISSGAVTWSKLAAAVQDSITSGSGGLAPDEVFLTESGGYMTIKDDEGAKNVLQSEDDGSVAWGKISGAYITDGTILWDDLSSATRDSISRAHNYINVRSYGAVGDGVTDDTDAIQAAIDYAYALGGGTVFFANGTYLVSKKRTYSCLVTYAGIKLLGTGARNSGLYSLAGGSTLLLAASQNTCMIVNQDYERLMNGETLDYWHFGSIENLTLFANGLNNTTKAECIKIANAGEMSVIRNVLFQAFRDTALVFQTSTPGLIENVSCFPCATAGADERIAMKITGRTCRIVAPSGDHCTPYFYVEGDGSLTIISPKLEFDSSNGDPAIYIVGNTTGSRAGMAQTVNVVGGNIWKTPVMNRNGDMVRIYSDSVWAGRIQLRGVVFAGFKNIIKQQTHHGITDSLYRKNTSDYYIDDIVWGNGYKLTRGDISYAGGITTSQQEINNTGLFTDRLYTPFLWAGERQNYLPYSDFGSGFYKEGSGALTVNSNVIIAPDGTSTADELVNTSATNGYGILENVSTGIPFTQGSKAIASVWMKAAGTTIGKAVSFVLGENGGGSAGGTTVTVYPTNQWELYHVKNQVKGAARTSLQYKVVVPADTDSLYVWGAQLNSGYEIYPYTATNGAAVTSGSSMVGGAATFNGTITVAENLGIGTTAPAEKLHVSGDIKADTLKAYVEDNRIGYAALDTAAAGYIDVRKFGAVGDGVANDSEAIRSAMDYAYTVWGSASSPSHTIAGHVVYFPPGIYCVDTTINVRTHVTLRGVPNVSTIRAHSTWDESFAHPLLRLGPTETHWALIDGMVLDCADKDSIIALYADNAQEWSGYRDGQIINNYGVGTIGIQIDGSQNASFSHLGAHGTLYAVDFKSTAGQISLDHSSFHNPSVDGVVINVRSSANRVSMYQVHTEATNSAGTIGFRIAAIGTVLINCDAHNIATGVQINSCWDYTLINFYAGYFNGGSMKVLDENNLSGKDIDGYNKYIPFLSVGRNSTQFNSKQHHTLTNFADYESNLLAENIRVSGKVGIGTTDATHPLSVGGLNSGYPRSLLNLRNTGTANNTAVDINFESGTGPTGIGILRVNNYDVSGGNTRFDFFTKGGGGWKQPLSIVQEYVGIGTTAPTAKLHVAGGGILAADSTSVGAGGIWIRNYRYVPGDSSVAFDFYNAALSRIDTVYAFQQAGAGGSGTGDITGVTAGDWITGGGTSGTVTVGVDTVKAASRAALAIGIKDSLAKAVLANGTRGLSADWAFGNYTISGRRALVDTSRATYFGIGMAPSTSYPVAISLEPTQYFYINKSGTSSNNDVFKVYNNCTSANAINLVINQPMFGVYQESVGWAKIKGSQLEATVTTGTAPFTVASTTLVTNLNADLLDGQHGAYYQAKSDTATTDATRKWVVDQAYAAGAHNHSGVYEPANANIQSHISSTLNPHSVTSTQVLPSQSGNNGKFLTTDGTSASWGSPGGSGDIEGVTAGDWITGGGTSGTVTVGVDTAKAASRAALAIGIKDSLAKAVLANGTRGLSADWAFGNYTISGRRAMVDTGRVSYFGLGLAPNASAPFSVELQPSEYFYVGKVGTSSNNDVIKIYNECTSATAVVLGINQPTFAVWQDAIGYAAIKGRSFESSVATGTAPFTVASTTVVSNLNADMVDGKSASAFLLTTDKASNVVDGDFGDVTVASGTWSIDANSSSGWAGKITDEVGTGKVLFDTNPVFTTSASFGSAGVKVTDDGDGAITLLGLGNGSDEDLTINLDDVSNEVGLSSSTGVTKINLGTMGLEIGDGKNITGEAKHLRFTVMAPASVFAVDSCICVWPKLDANITIDSLTVTTNSQSYELAGDLRYANAFIGRVGGSVGLIKAVDTSSGALYTGTFDDATIDAGKCIYLKLDSAPNSSVTQFAIDIRYRY